MTKHITVPLDEAELARARSAAEAQGVALEDYLRGLITANLPMEGTRSRQQMLLSKIIGMGSSDGPTDIAKDKDRLLAEAAWKEHVRETKQE